MTGLPGVPLKICVTQKDMSVLSGCESVMSGWCTLTSKLFLIRILFYAKFALYGRMQIRIPARRQFIFYSVQWTIILKVLLLLLLHPPS